MSLSSRSYIVSQATLVGLTGDYYCCCYILMQLFSAWKDLTVVSRNGLLYRVQFIKTIAFCPRWCYRKQTEHSVLACVAWRFWLGALSNKGGRGQRNCEWSFNLRRDKFVILGGRREVFFLPGRDAFDRIVLLYWAHCTKKYNFRNTLQRTFLNSY